MGMSASQGRLLFMTARISNNEFEQQSVAFSKERLSERASLVNERYNEALSATKYQILTGFNGVTANYEDLTYNMLTSYNSASSGRQYIVKDNKGKILVPNEIAKAFAANNGDFNKFLEAMGYTQADINAQNSSESKEAIHSAWDKYLVSVGKSIDNMGDLAEHILEFGYTSFSNNRYDGYPIYKSAVATTADGVYSPASLYKDDNGYYTENATITHYEDEGGNSIVYYQTEDQIGTDKHQKLDNVTYENGKYKYNDKEYDVLYVNPKNEVISENANDYLRLQVGNNYISNDGISYNVKIIERALNFEGTTKEQREFYDYAVALTEAYNNGETSGKYDAAMVNYYRNIFDEMKSCGYTTLYGEYDENRKNVQETDFKDNKWFVNQLKAGKLRISYYSTTSKAFLGTTIDDDSAICEKEDKTKIAQAEQEYNTQMDKIEHDEKMFDMQLSKLESEHQALTTELESINKVIKENVKESFGTFKA